MKLADLLKKTIAVICGMSIAVLSAMVNVPGVISVAEAQTVEVNCNKVAILDGNVTGALRVIAAANATSRTIICGYKLGGTTSTVKLEYGTGTNCATGETSLTPAFLTTSSTYIVDPGPVWSGLIVPPGNDVCVRLSAGANGQAEIHYFQQ